MKETNLELKTEILPDSPHITNDIWLPPIIQGTSNLGNLYEALPYERKLNIISEILKHSKSPAVFDSAGKYGAGLALESLNSCLRELEVHPEKVLISNKLGWLRTPLKTAEPTFEPGVWKGLQYDAKQSISYDGILACYEQGNQLLGNYRPQMLSIHDPDEYLDASNSDKDRAKRLQDILYAYLALQELKEQGLIKWIGVGAKNWRVVEMLSSHVNFDWIMLANSLTIYEHPPELLEFVSKMNNQGVHVINSAIFHGGFLMGSSFFNYRLVSDKNSTDKALLAWREKFFELCRNFGIKPFDACVHFSFSVQGVKSIALSSSSPERIAGNIASASVRVDAAFWEEMKQHKLISPDIGFL